MSSLDVWYQLTVIGISGQSRISVSKWWADKTQTDLVALLCAHFAGAIFEDIWANRMPSYAYLNLRHLLIKNVLRELESSKDVAADTMTLGLQYLSCGDLWYADSTSMASHRLGAETVFRQKGGLITWSQESPELAQALINKCLLMDVMLEQPAMADFDHLEPKEVSEAVQGGFSPFYWPEGADEITQQSPRCTPGVFTMLQKLQKVVGSIIYGEPAAASQQYAVSVLYTLVSQTRPSPALAMETEADRIGIVVRYAAILLTTAISYRVPISEAIEPVSQRLGVSDILETIDSALKLTDSSNFWGYEDFWGVLHFVSLILLPTTQLSVSEHESEKRQLMLRNLRAPSLMLCTALTTGRATPYFNNIRTMLRLQRWLDGDSASSVSKKSAAPPPSFGAGLLSDGRSWKNSIYPWLRHLPDEG